MMLFAYAFSKVFEKLRDILAPKEANTEPADKTFLGAIADDAAIIGTPDKAVLMYLHMQKIADEDFNLKFHTPKCAAFSFGLNKNDMIQAMEDAQNDILRDNHNYSLRPYRINFRALNISNDGIRLLGVPLGSTDFKIQYMEDVFQTVKEDWQKVLAKVSNHKWRLDLLKYCLNPRFNHLFRCVEPAITSTIADKLDKWFFDQVCEFICPHWENTDCALFRHFMTPVSYGGSGMTPFCTKIDVAYVASWIDCLFDKGIAFNGKLPDGSKPLSSLTTKI